VYLVSSLQSFLFAVLKSTPRRRWLRSRLALAHLDARCNLTLSNIDPQSLPDSRAGAYLWLVNELLCRRAKARLGSSLHVLEGDLIATSPETVLGAVYEHFGMEAGLRATTHECHHIAGHYSKRIAEPYNAATRLAERERADKHLRREIEDALAWIASLALFLPECRDIFEKRVH
jgi:hypothetical protein